VRSAQTLVAELQPHPLRKGSHYTAATYITIPRLLLYRNIIYMCRDSSGLIPCPQLQCRDAEMTSPSETGIIIFSKTLYSWKSSLRAHFTCRGLSLVIVRPATMNLWHVEGGSKNRHPADTSNNFLFPSSLSAS
jgi:hypothetical protein